MLSRAKTCFIYNVFKLKTYKRFTATTLITVSVYRDPYHNKTGITAYQLNVFESVREITGFVYIDAHDGSFISLSFLRNLRVIHGRKTYG